MIRYAKMRARLLNCEKLTLNVVVIYFVTTRVRRTHMHAGDLSLLSVAS